MRKLLICTIGFVVLSLPARADITGDQLQWNYYAYGGLYEAGTTWTVPGSGGDFCISCGQTLFSIDTDDTSITFNYSVDNTPGPWSPSVLSLSPTIYNGIAIDLLSGGPFTSVKIDPATNMVGFNGSDLSFTANQIQVNWANLAFSTSTIVKLDVNSTVSSVPEPATLFSVALMLGVLGWGRRKQMFAR